MTDTVTEKPPLEQVVEPVADTEAAIETGSAQPHADEIFVHGLGIAHVLDPPGAMPPSAPPGPAACRPSGAG